jgi:hypothetical protein
MSTTFVLSYTACLVNVDTDVEETDPTMLARCDGIAERSDLAQFASDNELPTELGVERITPVLRFADDALVLELRVASRREPTPADSEAIAGFADAMIEGGWGENYEFDLPDDLQDYQVHFSGPPRELVENPRLGAIQAIAQEWETLDHARIAAPPDVEVEALLARLQPLDRALTRGDDPTVERVRALRAALRARFQRRATAEAAARAGIAQVSVEDLDKLDELPDDVF